jgi:hypothetical protein
MMYPFVVPFFMAAYLQEKSGMAMFLCLMAGVVSKAGWVQAARYGMVLLFLMVLLDRTDRRKYFENSVQVALASGMVLMAFSMPYQYLVKGNDSSIWYAMLEGVIVTCMVLVFEQGICAFRVGTNRRFATNERFIGVFVLWLVALFGCPLITTPVNVLFCVCSYVLLYYTYRYEGGVGITAACVTGLVLAFQTGQVSFLAVEIIIACIAVLLKEIGKIGVLLAYVSGVVLLGILYESTLLEPAMLTAALVAAFAFFVSASGLPFKRPKITEKTTSEEMLVQKVVGTRVRDFGQAFLAMEKMLELHEEQRQEVRLEGLSNMYLSGDGISLLNAVESQSNRLLELRRNFMKQLGQIGETIAAFPGELTETALVSERTENRVAERLETMGVVADRVMSVKGKDGRIQMYVSCYGGKGVVTGKQLAKRIGRILGRKMVCVGRGEEVVGREESIFYFVEEGQYMLTTGVVRRGRKGQAVCGDNFSITKLDTQKAVLMLSDGMGSGENAFVKSQQIVDLLEQLLMAGFCRELAIELLNSFISFLTEGNLSSTLDLTMIDFYTGTADFIKLGASTTFIKRGKKVECIRSTSLPVGVLEQVEFDTCKRLLYHGDMVVMVSDGIMDGIVFENKEEYLAELIGDLDTCNAQGMAEAIMGAVENMHQAGLKDDSTVLVAGVWSR